MDLEAKTPLELLAETCDSIGQTSATKHAKLPPAYGWTRYPSAPSQQPRSITPVNTTVSLPPTFCASGSAASTRNAAPSFGSVDTMSTTKGQTGRRRSHRYNISEDRSKAFVYSPSSSGSPEEETPCADCTVCECNSSSVPTRRDQKLPGAHNQATTAKGFSPIPKEADTPNLSQFTGLADRSHPFQCSLPLLPCIPPLIPLYPAFPHSPTGILPGYHEIDQRLTNGRALAGSSLSPRTKGKNKAAHPNRSELEVSLPSTICSPCRNKERSPNPPALTPLAAMSKFASGAEALARSSKPNLAPSNTRPDNMAQLQASNKRLLSPLSLNEVAPQLSTNLNLLQDSLARVGFSSFTQEEELFRLGGLSPIAAPSYLADLIRRATYSSRILASMDYERYSPYGILRKPGFLPLAGVDPLLSIPALTNTITNTSMLK